MMQKKEVFAVIYLYDNIKNRRLELGMSQEDLALKVGYSDRTSIAKIEAGKVDISQSKILAFADALNTTPSSLMGWDDEKPAPKTENELDEEFIRLWRRLTPEQAERELAYLRSLADGKDK